MITRRNLLRTGAGLAAGAMLARVGFAQDAPAVEVINPRGRVPLSFIIDDSTCLVNMGSYCMPQFAAAWPTREIYKKPWKTWPREIPDDFVREFCDWCGEHGVRGKYSIVPYPACVGWLDRELPGWGKQELHDSLKLVRERMMPGWDIHPEMVTHTRVINVKTGRPIEPMNNMTMENSYPSARKSADEIGEYVAYALRILKNVELPCEGITTPGGFGNFVKSELALGIKQAVKDVFSPEIPHYFKYVNEGKERTWGKLEHLEGKDTDSPSFVVNVPAGTGDYFGGWDGDEVPQPDKYATKDASSGRMVELIERGEPAVMLCHWAGMYTQATKRGFDAFKQVVVALEQKYKDRTVWMKVSEIARYTAARELTRMQRADGAVTVNAPFACPAFTLRVKDAPAGAVKLDKEELGQAQAMKDLTPGKFVRENKDVVLCWDLKKGASAVQIG